MSNFAMKIVREPNRLRLELSAESKAIFREIEANAARKEAERAKSTSKGTPSIQVNEAGSVLF